ncbi:MAG: glycosyltransferase family 2 protein [Steroidobacteraceae bacterium]|jgi:cellulose synthase/poly-beta-1,6-N-acetylglucosamine synthase-like glycosyltransferase
MVLQILLGAVALALLLPVVVLFVEVLLAVTGRADGRVPKSERPPIAVVMPAHNEATLIADTLRSIVPQLERFDRLIVVADNCSDETAATAAAEGAEVVVRTDSNRRGKGYALDAGVRHLEAESPGVVIIIDADCHVAANSIDRLVRCCARTARPVQALYLMHAGKNAGLNMRVAEFAWAVRNQVRPAGLHRLGLPCQLMGTGMAFPWFHIRSANLATGHIVEDLKLGIDLALAGTPPLFCPEALVTSDFPVSADGVQSQRTRWEHGHLSVILTEAPRLFWYALTRLNLQLLVMALDLSVPPLSLLVLQVVGIWVASTVMCVVTGAQFAFAVSTIAVALFALSVFLSWARFGRRIITLGDLVFSILYVLSKVPLYLRALVARQHAWVRSKREDEKL